MGRAGFDSNNIHTLIGISSDGLRTPIEVYLDPTTHEMFVKSSPGFPSAYDYIDVQQTSSTVDTYVFKIGGSGGTTVKTVVLTYTDATKDNLDTVAYS